jgi:hypothetical protein
MCNRTDCAGLSFKPRIVFVLFVQVKIMSLPGQQESTLTILVRRMLLPEEWFDFISYKSNKNRYTYT